jgi:hypothetical protein
MPQGNCYDRDQDGQQKQQLLKISNNGDMHENGDSAFYLVAAYIWVEKPIEKSRTCHHDPIIMSLFHALRIHREL